MASKKRLPSATPPISVAAFERQTRIAKAFFLSQIEELLALRKENALTPEFARVREDLLAKEFQSFLEVVDPLKHADNLPDGLSEEAFEDRCQEIGLIYFRIQQILGEDRPQQPSSPVSASTASSNPIPHPRLPAIPIPTFSGDICRWGEFRALFQSIVIDQTSHSDVDRLHYLFGVLEGPPRAIVTNIPLEEGQFGRAWHALCTAYNNRRHFAETLLQRLLDVPSQTPFPSVQNLERLLTGPLKAAPPY